MDRTTNTLGWIVAIIFLAVVVGCIMAFFRLKSSQPIVTPPVATVGGCVESSRQTDGAGRIYTCIEGQWIYTGVTGSFKE